MNKCLISKLYHSILVDYLVPLLDQYCFLGVCYDNFGEK